MYQQLLWALVIQIEQSACMYAKSLQSCLTLCDPVNCSLLGSSGHGTLQARILQWVAMPSSRGFPQPRDRTHISYVSCTGRQILLFTSYSWETQKDQLLKYQLFIYQKENAS